MERRIDRGPDRIAAAGRELVHFRGQHDAKDMAAAGHVGLKLVEQPFPHRQEVVAPRRRIGRDGAAAAAVRLRAIGAADAAAVVRVVALDPEIGMTAAGAWICRPADIGRHPERAGACVGAG